MSKASNRKHSEKKKKEVSVGDRLEKQGQVTRKWSLIIGILATLILPLLVFGIVKLITDQSLLHLLAVVSIFAGVGIYSFDSSIKPGYVGILSWWGYLLPIYVGHGANWAPKIFGVKFEQIKVRIIISRLPLVTVLDKNNAEVTFKNVRAKYQIIRPIPFCLNTTEEDLNDEVDSKTQEALREEASGTTYEKLKAMTSEDQKSIKTKIEAKLEEEQDLGTNMVAIEWTEVVPGEIIRTEDQELRARRKRMNLAKTHAKQLAKEGLKFKEAIEQVKIIYGITSEEIKKIEQEHEHKVDIGENVSELLNPFAALLAEKLMGKESGTEKPKKKESKK